MDFYFLPEKYRRAVLKSNTETLSEIRFRTGYPVFCIVGGKKYFFNNNALTVKEIDGEICEKKDVNDIIEKVTEKSLYAFNDRIKQGYLTTKSGVRIGVAGECVFEKGNIITIRDITSLNIRIPHEIKDCSLFIYEKIFADALYDTLIISPPSKGKTTLLKDLARKINEKNNVSLLIIDERGEFYGVTGENIDVIRYSDKKYALNYAVRSMSPTVVITDELQTADDWNCAKNAVSSGIKIVASCHGGNVNDLMAKDGFTKGVFKRYVVLDSGVKAGVVKNVYDGDFKLI